MALVLPKEMGPIPRAQRAAVAGLIALAFALCFFLLGYVIGGVVLGGAGAVLVALAAWFSRKPGQRANPSS
jgi:hypothetical protein